MANILAVMHQYAAIGEGSGLRVGWLRGLSFCLGHSLSLPLSVMFVPACFSSPGHFL